MAKNNIDMYIVPSIDAHNNEYVPECWRRVAWISNFTGSAAEVLVTKDHAYLWTDGRYFLQAEAELDNKFYTLMKQSGAGTKIESWLHDNCNNKILGIDPKVISIKRAESLQFLMNNISGKIVFINDNLIDNCKLQNGENPTLPTNEMYKLDDKYTGQSVPDKLNYLRQHLIQNSANFIVLTVLDEIAWLFNFRGSDIAYNPLVICYAIVGISHAWLFVNKDKVANELMAEFNNLGVTILDYNSFDTQLYTLNGLIWLDDKTANYSTFNNIGKAVAENPTATSNQPQILLNRSPIIAAKACKNQTEQDGAKQAHIKDAVAVIGFLSWLNDSWQSGIDEISCENRLSEFRQKEENIIGASFPTISGFAGNGAIVHYRVTPKTNKIVDDSNLYLVDSGGQYLEGTTDITRTIHLGTPTAMQKKHYTLVLKGHLALERSIFPSGTNGEHLDVLARQALWNEFLDYHHGTGHGVGSFLCVHEGPQGISKRLSGVALVPGMIVSNEPGFYLSGKYGIRIENLCLVSAIEDSLAQTSEFGPFYHFKTLTLVPYCKKLIDFELLDNIEKKQIIKYYADIKNKVRHLLGAKEQIWLDNELNILN